MRKPYPHLLQTPSWGRAKCKAQPSWRRYFFTMPAGAAASGTAGFRAAEAMADPSAVESSVLILERSLGWGQRLHYIPRGPYVDWQDEALADLTLRFIKEFARKRSVIMVRLEPDVPEPGFDYERMVRMGFRRTADHIQPKDTVRFPIRFADDELLAMFHKKHRYNIKLAGKRGLRVRTSASPEDVTRFYSLLKQTERRHGGVLHIHPEEYYQVITRELAADGLALLYLVEKDDNLVSASLVTSYGNEAIYMYGASDYEFRRDMPNHLREWQAIRDARDAGREYFDMWGATMRNDPGGGIRRYKLGYHDRIEVLAGCFDWSPSPLKYRAFTLLNKLRRGF
jgi:peptidoglycan pentaglycine glycine transferase (the first glycine)